MSGVITTGNAIHVINLLTAIRHEIFNQIYNKKDGKVTGILGDRQGGDDKYYNTNELTPEQKEELKTLFLRNEKRKMLSLSTRKQLHTKFNKKDYLSDKSILEFIIKYGTNCLDFPESVLGQDTKKYVQKIDESIEYFANNKYATEEIGKILEEQIRYKDPNDNTKTIGLITSIFNIDITKLENETDIETMGCGEIEDWTTCKTNENSKEKKIHYRNIAICSFLKGAEKYYIDNEIDIPLQLEQLDGFNFACKYNSKCNTTSSSSDKEAAKEDEDITKVMESLTINPDNGKETGGKRKTKRKNKKSKKSSRKKRKHRKTRKSKK